ncbi:MAG TPA: hypothetical protein VG323_07165 [Thermoanaerobaculia bacterium]|nr:hypothetical protein [Thermoanaerobaculia bacterium]
MSTSALLAVAAWKLSSIFAHVLAIGPLQRLGPAFDSLWMAWLVAGVVTGRDFTWHLRLDRLIVLPLSFLRLYLIDSLLAFLSVSIAILFGILTVYGVRSHWPAALWPFALAGAVAFILTVRASVSVVRAAIFRGTALSAAARIALWPAIVLAAVAGLWFRPGRELAAILRGSEPALNLALLLVTALVVAAIDYATLRSVVYSGLLGPRSGARRAAGKAHLLTAGPRALSPLLRVSFLGWLRNRSALLLLLWGAAYGFAYPYFMKVSGAIDFVMFVWMVLIFHSYLRGNVLGVDNGGVWLYTLLGVPAGRAVRAKNTSLTAMQLVMAGCVVLAAALKNASGMSRPLDWACLLGFACAAILAGELAGTIFSILHPEPIERTSMYSGGLTMGALVIPAIQLILAVVYIVAFVAPLRDLPEGAKWIVFLGVPFCLAVLRWRALPVWRKSLLERAGDDLLDKLSAVTP